MRKRDYCICSLFYTRDFFIGSGGNYVSKYDIAVCDLEHFPLQDLFHNPLKSVGVGVFR